MPYNHYTLNLTQCHTTYCASKWGVRGFTKALAKEVPRIKVLTAHPGPTKTNIYGDWKGGNDPEIVAEALYKIVMNQQKYNSGEDIKLFEVTKRGES